MPAIRFQAQQAASRTNGARSRGPASEAGKACSARNGTRHGLRGGPFALLPGEDRDELDRLHAARGSRAVSLGPLILRAETAALVALAAWRLAQTDA